MGKVSEMMPYVITELDLIGYTFGSFREVEGKYQSFSMTREKERLNIGIVRIIVTNGNEF